MALQRPYVVYRQDPEKRLWRRRERWLYWGAPMALLPAIALLPVLAFFIYKPVVPWAQPVGYAMLPLIGVCGILGAVRLGWCLRAKFDVISAFAASAIVLLMVVMIYTGVFAAALLFQ